MVGESQRQLSSSSECPETATTSRRSAAAAAAAAEIDCQLQLETTANICSSSRLSTAHTADNTHS